MKKAVFLLFTFFFYSLQSQVVKKGDKNSNMDTPVLYSIEAPSAKQIEEFPYSYLEFDTLSFEDSIPDAQLLYYAEKVANRAIQLENIIINNRLRIEYSKKLLEQEYADLKENEDADEEELKALKDNIKSLKKEKKRLTKARLRAKKIAARAVHTSERDVEEIRLALPQIKEEVIVLSDLAGRSRDWIKQDLEYVKGEKDALDFMHKSKEERLRIEADDATKLSNRRRRKKADKSENNNRENGDDEIVMFHESFDSIPQQENTAFLSSKPTDYTPYSVSDDVLKNPPSLPCNLLVNTIDQFSGKVHKQTKEAELFRFTNDFMKQYLNGKPHIQCFASTSQLGEVTAVILSVYIRDNNAENAFGGLKQNYNLTFKFIDGTTKSSPNLKEETPLVLENGARTVYKGSFPLGKSILKKLRTSELDKVRIQWATGYEDYEIYNIDLLSQQADCILGK